MHDRTRWATWVATVLLAAGLAGCTDALTVWPVAAGARGDAAVDVPPLAGRWRAIDAGEDGPTLDVEQVPGERGTCRGGMVTYTEDGNATRIGDQTCFIDLAGYLVAEVRSVEPIASFYRQYLVKLQADRIEVCTGLPVWVLLAELQKEGGAGFTLESLDYTLRERESGDLMVFISRPQAMREFLAVALPEAAAACDRNEEGFVWIAFERVEPDTAAESTVPE